MAKIDIEQHHKNLQSVFEDLIYFATEKERLNKELQKYKAQFSDAAEGNIEQDDDEESIQEKYDVLLKEYNVLREYLSDAQILEKTKILQKLEKEKEKDKNTIQKLEDEKRKTKIAIEQVVKGNDQLKNERDKIKAEYDTLQRKHIKLCEYLSDAQKLEKAVERLEHEKEKLKTANTTLQHENMALKQQNQGFQTIISTLQRENTTLTQENKLPKESKNALNDSTISAFNNWASNPGPPLPAGFEYVEGEIRIGNTQEIKSSSIPAKWVTDRNRKYLFPNPNSFDQMTDITDLYKMDMAQLRPKLYNKIKIVKACEISETGFIEFPGELKIL